MSATADRKETVDFTDNYYRATMFALVKKGGKFTDAKSARGPERRGLHLAAKHHLVRPAQADPQREDSAGSCRRLLHGRLAAVGQMRSASGGQAHRPCGGLRQQGSEKHRPRRRQGPQGAGRADGHRRRRAEGQHGAERFHQQGTLEYQRKRTLEDDGSGD